MLAARKRQDGVSEEDLRANYAQVCLAVLCIPFYSVVGDD